MKKRQVLMQALLLGLTSPLFCMHSVSSSRFAPEGPSSRKPTEQSLVKQTQNKQSEKPWQKKLTPEQRAQNKASQEYVTIKTPESVTISRNGNIVAQENTEYIPTPRPKNEVDLNISSFTKNEETIRTDQGQILKAQDSQGNTLEWNTDTDQYRFNNKEVVISKPVYKKALEPIAERLSLSSSMQRNQRNAQNKALTRISEALNINAITKKPVSSEGLKIYNQIKSDALVEYLKEQNSSKLIELLISSPRIQSEGTPITKAAVFNAMMSNLGDVTGINGLRNRLSKKSQNQGDVTVIATEAQELEKFVDAIKVQASELITPELNKPVPSTSKITAIITWVGEQFSALYKSATSKSNNNTRNNSTESKKTEQNKNQNDALEPIDKLNEGIELNTFSTELLPSDNLSNNSKPSSETINPEIADLQQNINKNQKLLKQDNINLLDQAYYEQNIKDAITRKNQLQLSLRTKPESRSVEDLNQLIETSKKRIQEAESLSNTFKSDPKVQSDANATIEAHNNSIKQYQTELSQLQNPQPESNAQGLSRSERSQSEHSKNKDNKSVTDLTTLSDADLIDMAKKTSLEIGKLQRQSWTSDVAKQQEIDLKISQQKEFENSLRDEAENRSIELFR